jgi:UDP-N-acetylmuramoyl-L-alanyl-D-glutamate--2,6-diaminopimelate ligase
LRLKKIIQDLEITSIRGDQDLHVGKITFDSRDVNEGDLFVAIRGTLADGHSYMDRAISSGAAAVVCEDPGETSGVPVICVPDSRRALVR